MPTNRECVPSSALSHKIFISHKKMAEFHESYSLCSFSPLCTSEEEAEVPQIQYYILTYMQECNRYTFVQFESTVSFIFLNKGLLEKIPIFK